MKYKHSTNTSTGSLILGFTVYQVVGGVVELADDANPIALIQEGFELVPVSAKKTRTVEVEEGAEGA